MDLFIFRECDNIVIQTQTSCLSRACTGFDGGFEVWEAIRGLRNRVINLELNINADNNEFALAA